ncbi:hypothetical protein E2I00_016323, partial [Balaenoptera physalus]
AIGCVSNCDSVCPLWGVDLSSPRPFCVFIVVYNYARLPSRHVCWVACPLRLCLDGLVVVSGVCDPDYVGLCVPERLRLIDFVVSCWTMFGPDRVGLGKAKTPFHNLDLGSRPSPAGGGVEILFRGAALSKYAP